MSLFPYLLQLSTVLQLNVSMTLRDVKPFESGVKKIFFHIIQYVNHRHG